jgi:4-hydroxy-tetrahydrodipicolinate synthase
MSTRFQGCYTAVVTPFDDKGKVDWDELRALVQFQVLQGVRGVVPAGTTGESPTLSWEEHNGVIDSAFEASGSRLETIASTGSNSTEESLEATRHAVDMGIGAVLLVDPYYNGPSSLEIRREYYQPIAREFPDTRIIPYVIPGRTGTQLLPQDLAMLHGENPNVSGVKEATGDSANARLVRKFCGPEFSILSGDDDKTLAMMRDPEIMCSGVISVVSNVAPRAVQRMVDAGLAGRWAEAERLGNALRPLFSLVTVKRDEQTPMGPVTVRARNPVPVKTVMRILGMIKGQCRAPLGRMTKGGLEMVLRELNSVWANDPELLEPLQGAFDVSIEDRLQNPKFREGLAYERY